MSNSIINSYSKINNRGNILLYTLAVLMILNCQSVYALSFNIVGKGISILFQILLLFLFCRSLINLKDLTRLKTFILFSFIYLSYIFIFLLIEYVFYNQIAQLNIINSFFDIIMFVGYFLSNSNKHNIINKDLMKNYVNIVYLLAIVSILFWIMFMLGLKPNMVLHTNWAGGVNGGMTPGFSYVDFMSQGKVHLLFLNDVVRNTGIFIEAPMYAYVLCVALFIHLFLRNSPKIFDRKTIIILITLFTTTSSVGISIGLLSLLFKYISISRSHYYGYILSVILLVFSLIIIWYLFRSKANLGMSGGTVNYNSSYFLRRDDMFACLKAWKNHLFIGNGPNNLGAIHQYMNITRILSNNMGIATGFLKILALGGILYGAFYLVPVLLVLKIRDVNCVAILSFVIFIMIVVPNAYIYIMILSYLWASYLNCYIPNK